MRDGLVRVSAFAGVLLFVALACGTDRLVTLEPELEVPDELDFGIAYVGHPSEALVSLHNRSRFPLVLETSGGIPEFCEVDDGAHYAWPMGFFIVIVRAKPLGDFRAVNRIEDVGEFFALLGIQLFQKREESEWLSAGICARSCHDADEIASLQFAESWFQGSCECNGKGGVVPQANLQGFHDVVPPLGGTVPALDLARGHAFPQFCKDEFARVAFRFLLPQGRVEVIHHPLAGHRVIFAGRHGQERRKDLEVKGIVFREAGERLKCGIPHPPVRVFDPWLDELVALLDILGRSELECHQGTGLDIP